MFSEWHTICKYVTYEEWLSDCQESWCRQSFRAQLFFHKKSLINHQSSCWQLSHPNLGFVPFVLSYSHSSWQATLRYEGIIPVEERWCGCSANHKWWHFYNDLVAIKYWVLATGDDTWTLTPSRQKSWQVPICLFVPSSFHTVFCGGNE